MSLLEIQNLSVAFQTAGGLFTAVDKVSLTINPGEVASIVGESGSGKSVAMLALMGLLPWTANVTADVLKFDGQDLKTINKNDMRKIIDMQMDSMLLAVFGFGQVPDPVVHVGIAVDVCHLGPQLLVVGGDGKEMGPR